MLKYSILSLSLSFSHMHTLTHTHSNSVSFCLSNSLSLAQTHTQVFCTYHIKLVFENLFTPKGGSKKSKNFRPSAVRQCPSPSDSPPTDGPSDHKKTSPDIALVRRPTSDERPGANTVGSILYDV